MTWFDDGLSITSLTGEAEPGLLANIIGDPGLFLFSLSNRINIKSALLVLQEVRDLLLLLFTNIASCLYVHGYQHWPQSCSSSHFILFLFFVTLFLISTAFNRIIVFFSELAGLARGNEKFKSGQI